MVLATQISDSTAVPYRAWFQCMHCPDQHYCADRGRLPLQVVWWFARSPARYGGAQGSGAGQVADAFRPPLYAHPLSLWFFGMGQKGDGLPGSG